MDTPGQKLEKLIQTVKDNDPSADLDMLKLAFEFANEAHKGQTRISKEPYIFHPLATAQKLAEFKLDLTTIIAGLLHDIPEDTKIPLTEIERNFGSEISGLVAGITKLGKIKYRGMERYAENLRKMFIAMSRDIRIIFIKFADRIHNLETLSVLPQDKKSRIAAESMEIYAPIADRLGMSQIKGELEDLSFPYIHPEDCRWLKKIISKEFKKKEKYLEKVRKKVLEELGKKDPAINIISFHGRTKHTFSLYKKLLRPEINKDISKVYDFLALRLIVPSIADCYIVLGILHQLYKPMPGHIKDYISQPKPNGYQSLHTSVFTENGEIVEFQIRTLKMHQEAEYGIAAHWHFKETGSKNPDKKNLLWIEKLVKWQKQTQDNDQFLKDIRLDIFQNRIFVFTPKGDVIDLPENATPLDFAYHVHSSLGDQCVGARINDQFVSLNSVLKSGDIAEIITDKNRKGPSPDWLDIARTTTAKNKIRIALNKQKKA